MIPEGGSNSLGVKGCQEILTEIDLDFDYLCCAIGTGCTASGLIKSMKKKHKLLGFSPFKKNNEQKNLKDKEIGEDEFKKFAGQVEILIDHASNFGQTLAFHAHPASLAETEKELIRALETALSEKKDDAIKINRKKRAEMHLTVNLVQKFEQFRQKLFV